MDKALYFRNELEQNGISLFDSFNSYILEELGITLTESSTHSPLTFEVRAANLKNDRWDVGFWKKEHSNLENAIRSGKFPIVSFEELIKKIVNGLDFREFVETGAEYLRVSNIKPFEVDKSEIKHVPLRVIEVSKDIQLTMNDVLLTRKGTFGVATIVSENIIDCIISSEIFRVILRSDIEINSYYIVCLLNSKLGYRQFVRKSIGAIMGSLSQDAVKSIILPFPPKKVQDKIAREIRERNLKIMELRTNARIVLEKAIEEVEKEMIGEVLP